MGEIVSILLIILAILNLILFFKIWGMTNNVKTLLQIYMHEKGIKIADGSNSIDKWYLDKDGNEIRDF